MPLEDYASPVDDSSGNDQWKHLASPIATPKKEKESTTLGAVGRSAALGALPAAGGLAAGYAGAELGAVGGTVVGGPIGGLVGGVAGGLAGAFGGSALIDKAQSFVPDRVRSSLGLSREQEQADETQHPYASMAGRMLPYAVAMKPGGGLKQAALGGALGGGIEAGQEALGPNGLDPKRIAIATGTGALFNELRFGMGARKTSPAPLSPALEARIAKFASPEQPGSLPPKGAELPIQPESATPPSAGTAAPKSEIIPPGVAEPEVKAPLDAVVPKRGFSVENNGPSTVFKGANKFRVKDANGEHITTIMAKQEGGSIKIEGVGGGASGMTEKNMFGTSAMRKILPQLQEHFPTATHIEGVRTTGISAKNVGGVGDRVAKIKLKPLNKEIISKETDLRSSAPAGVRSEAPLAPAESRGGAQRLSSPDARGVLPRSQPVGAAPTGYPELSTAGRGGAQAILQQRLGLGEREATKAITALEPYQAELNAVPRSERLKTIDYMENRSHGNTSINPKFQAAANEMRRVYKDIEFRLGNTTSTEHMHFIEDYFRHQVKDPKKMPSFMSAFKEGSAKGATKKRSFPTVSDLLEAGHELVNDNPVEVTMDYAYHMNKFIATNEAFDIAKTQGTIKYMSPSRVPDGWLPIQGRHGGLNQHGQAAYAPAAFAESWNNFVSQGFTGLGGDMIKGARSITNATTAVKLMSGYHFLTMGAASYTSELSRAFDNLAYGRPMAALRAGGSAATILGPILRQFKTGLRGQRIYGGGAGTAEENKIVDYLTQANFRPSKIDRSISVTQTGNLYTAWKRGALSHQLRSQMSDIAAAPGIMKAAPIAHSVWNLFGRTIDTIMAPLFEKIIPALKTGAAMESLRDYLIARPSASFEEIMTEARAVQKNMDDRFGEMNHDNLFWNNKLKEGLQASMLSYSWNVGIGRAIGGGGKDIVAALGNKATAGKFGSAGWTRRASYALAFPIGAAYLSAVYQALKTGQAPKGPQDLLAPRTGGDNPATKYRKESDERIAIPGHMKDVFEVRDVFTGDKTIWDVAANKLNPVLHLAGNMIVGRDWRGNPIADPEAATQDKIKQYGRYMLEQMSPIALSQFEKRKEGTNINLFETVLGIHPAPDFLQDPTGHGDIMRSMANQQWVKTLSALEREAKGRGDTDRATAIQQEIHRRQQQMKRVQP